MFARMRRVLGRLLDRSRTINNEPLNRVSLIVILLVDLFILANVFTGLDDISRWHLSPTQAHPCYSEWSSYQDRTNSRQDYDVIRSAILLENTNRNGYDDSGFSPQVDLIKKYKENVKSKLGTITNVCFEYAEIRDKINTSENQKTVASIDRQQADIGKLESTNQTIKSQYDSSLLDKIAGQERGRSINQVGAEKAKQTLEQNNAKILNLKQKNTELKNLLVAKPESSTFISLLKDSNKFKILKSDYDRASFWYPSIQFGFQFGFLLPLLLGALVVNNFAQRHGYGLIALISWHLLVIFLIPLLFKALEFLQIGAIFNLISGIVYKLFGSLLFLISYIYILLVPLVGFGLIKVFQEFVFNSKIQTANRVQKSQCVKCARKIRSADIYCPHCSYYQLSECRNCHHLTYKDLPYCNQCGHSQQQ